MPKSRLRKKKKSQQDPEAPDAKAEPKPGGGGRWVAPLMITLLVGGLAWIVVFYLAGSSIPYMQDLGNWNLAVGMGAIMLGLITAMKWE